MLRQFATIFVQKPGNRCRSFRDHAHGTVHHRVAHEPFTRQCRIVAARPHRLAVRMQCDEPISRARLLLDAHAGIAPDARPWPVPTHCLRPVQIGVSDAFLLFQCPVIRRDGPCAVESEDGGNE